MDAIAAWRMLRFSRFEFGELHPIVFFYRRVA